MVPGVSEGGTVTVVGAAQPGNERLKAEAGQVPHPTELSFLWGMARQRPLPDV